MVNPGHSGQGLLLMDHFCNPLHRFPRLRQAIPVCLKHMVHRFPDIQYDVCPLGLRPFKVGSNHIDEDFSPPCLEVDRWQPTQIRMDR